MPIPTSIITCVSPNVSHTALWCHPTVRIDREDQMRGHLQQTGHYWALLGAERAVL